MCVAEIDQVGDAETINLELILSDLELLEKRIVAKEKRTILQPVKKKPGPGVKQGTKAPQVWFIQSFDVELRFLK